MKKRLVYNRLAALAAMAILLSSSPRIGFTQPSCPSLPGDCNTWTEITITAPMSGTPLNSPDSVNCGNNTSTSCCVQMTFCYECCNGVVETILEQVQPVTSSCSGVNPQSFIDFASWYASVWGIYEYMGGGGNCDVKNNPCPDQDLEVISYTPTCWKLNNVFGSGVYLACSTDGCFCQTDYNACWDGTKIEYGPYAYYTVGTCTCTPAPTPPATWTAGTCYSILCPDGKGGRQ